jgi:hypothetical protein
LIGKNNEGMPFYIEIPYRIEIVYEEVENPFSSEVRSHSDETHALKEEKRKERTRTLRKKKEERRKKKEERRRRDSQPLYIKVEDYLNSY